MGSAAWACSQPWCVIYPRFPIWGQSFCWFRIAVNICYIHGYVAMPCDAQEHVVLGSEPDSAQTKHGPCPLQSLQFFGRHDHVHCKYFKVEVTADAEPEDRFPSGSKHGEWKKSPKSSLPPLHEHKSSWPSASPSEHIVVPEPTKYGWKLFCFKHKYGPVPGPPPRLMQSLIYPASSIELKEEQTALLISKCLQWNLCSSLKKFKCLSYTTGKPWRHYTKCVKPAIRDANIWFHLENAPKLTLDS